MIPTYIAETLNAVRINEIHKLLDDKSVHIKLNRLHGSSLSFYISTLLEEHPQNLIFIANNKEEAAYYFNDFEKLFSKIKVFFYPSSHRRPYQIEETNNANILQRAELLQNISKNSDPLLVVTYPEALFEKVIDRETLNKKTFHLKKGDQLDLDFVNEVLFDYGFERVDFVTEPGTFAVRGGIIDLYSYAGENPYRIEFFDNEVESIRTFDIESQLSEKPLEQIQIVSNIENKSNSETRLSFLEFINNHFILLKFNQNHIVDTIDNLYSKAQKIYDSQENTIQQIPPNQLYINGSDFSRSCLNFRQISIGQNAEENSVDSFDFHCMPQPHFNRQFDLLIAHLDENTQKGIRNVLCCSNENQKDRLKEIINSIAENDQDLNLEFNTIILPLYQGFIDNNQKIACYTDHQIFERYHKFQLKTQQRKKQTITLKEITDLKNGDFVTHIDHGIGKFAGLQKIDVDGKKQEAIKLVYGEGDILYVSIHALHKISKYNGKDGKPPKIFKLGSGAWKKIKQKTKKKVKEIAFDLIELYAKRKTQKGFSFQPDSYLQHELEASFLYEDTPDQITTTEVVKKDMESEQPMDRLICGDVGFGKTEIAIRAAFKAADNGKQVAILVPTTILAFQHYKSFKNRLKDFPIDIEYLNRFRTAKQKTDILKRLADGKIDIIIGTHQLVNKNVVYKDLGLLIIDEEQKFGVSVKDKLKTIKANIDTLTLTATPIPRTLQFSLMAARDLSIISTPPPNRHPIETQVIGFQEETIRDAIAYEINRKGQVFFIHNRIENIREVAGALQRLVPDAKIGVGHGQLDGKKLEELLVSFMNGEFDVLVATTIIESGLDVPNANTIFINHANNFGVSDLHQMRGRVGRSNKKAFCYLITPPFHLMTSDAQKRIQAISVFSELGSGIQIAMKDLEIRGAGNLLGGEQSGFISDIGFETYQKILNEAIEELKQNEFKDLYQEEDNEDISYVKDLQLDTDLELLIPDDYISVVNERYSLYKTLSEIDNEEDLNVFSNNLIDRFGAMPYEVENLLTSVKIKWMAKKLGVERIILKRKTLIAYFISDQQSAFYESQTFQQILLFAQKNQAQCQLKEKQTNQGLKLLLRSDQINNIREAYQFLKGILDESKLKTV